MSLRRKLAVLVSVVLTTSFLTAVPSATARPLKEVAAPSAKVVAQAATAPIIDSTRCGCPPGITCLTYDDSFYGGKTYNIVYLAQHAKEKDVGLTFFQLTQQTNEYRAKTGVDIFPLLWKNGQYTGNHTYNHADLAHSSGERIRWQIAVGAPGAWLRPPGGASNVSVIWNAHYLGRNVCTWTFDSLDTRRVNGKFLTGAQICSRVVSQAPKGAVVLLHLHRSAATYAAMDCMINGLRARGHSICRPYHASHPGVATPAKLVSLPC